MNELYRPDVGQVYRRYRPNVAHFYPDWFQQLEDVAKKSNLGFSDKSRLPYELERYTLAKMGDMANTEPFRMIVLMGPLCSGKSLIKGLLKLKGLPTVKDYMARPARANEVDYDEYEFVSEDNLSRLYEAGTLVYVNEHAYTDKEQPYKSGFPKQPFIDLVRGEIPFFITKTFGGWDKLEDFLSHSSENSQFLETEVVNAFLLPPAPHVLVLRAIQRTLNNFQVPLFAGLDPEVEERLTTEFDRSIGRANIIGQSSRLKRIVYLVNDDPDRVVSNILSLLP